MFFSQQTTTDSQRAHTPPPPEEPLPAGWTRLVSRSHGKTFYFHKDTNTTSWSRPTGQPDRPKSPPAPPPEDKPDVAVPANREAGVSQTAKSQPVSPEKSAMQNSGGVNAEQSTKQESPKQQDNSNGTASAGKADRERAPPSGPSGWKGFHEERGRARSPDPRGSGGREDDPKRFRGDDRDREAYRRTLFSSSPISPASPHALVSSAWLPIRAAALDGRARCISRYASSGCLTVASGRSLLGKVARNRTVQGPYPVPTSGLT